MSTLRNWLRGHWAVPVISGTLIAASFVAGRTLGELPSDVLMVAAAVVAGAGIVVKAVRALVAGVVGIDLLVSVAAIGAVVLGNFWEAAAVTFLFAVGHALEAATLSKTRAALTDLISVAPETAIVLRDGEQIEVPAAQVVTGETVLIKNGGKVPVDGTITAGHGALDESSITGESIPAEKTIDDTVFAGTISTGGLLQVKATGVGADTTLARIISRVEDAQDAKARTQAFIDRFSRWYTPGVIALAILAGLITGDVTLGLTLLVIGCPGALVISIPVTIVAGIGRAARSGILIKGGEFLETSAKIDAVALDKTGTLTQGSPQLTDVVVIREGLDRSEVLRMAALAEAGSQHPLARPILEGARSLGVAPERVPGNVETVPGQGIVAAWDDHRILVGNATLLRAEAVQDLTAEAAQVADRLAAAGKTPMIVAVDGAAMGVIGVADQLRPEASELIEQLHRAGVRRVVMLTGDAAPVAEAVGREVGVDEVHAALLPEDKLAVVADLQRQGMTVAMVGDGVNDAPALATADIGVAMGAAGSAVAIETADIALMGDKLSRLPQAIALAKRTTRVMRQNIVIALVTVVALLAGVFFGGVTMSVGMLVHEASVLVVILNAMRLLRGLQHRNLTSAEQRTGQVASPRPLAVN